MNTMVAFLYLDTVLRGQCYGYYQCLVKESYFILLELFHNFDDDPNFSIRKLANCTIETVCYSRPVLWIYVR